MNDEDPIKNDGARVLTSLWYDFSDAQEQPKSVIEFRRNLNSSKLLRLSLLPARMKKIQSKIKALEIPIIRLWESFQTLKGRLLRSM